MIEVFAEIGALNARRANWRMGAIFVERFYGRIAQREPTSATNGFAA